jgi:hypothetical protein
MTSEDLATQGSRLANQTVTALRGAGVEVIGKTGGTLTDDKRGGTFATGNVTLSAAGAAVLVQKLTGAAIGDRDPGAAVRSALYEHHIGGLVSQGPDAGSVGLAQLTEGVVQAIIAAVGK